MIIAPLQDYARYLPLHQKFAIGFEFLRQGNLAELADGRHEIDGEETFAIVARSLGRGQADSPLEFHRRYLDIQFVVSGVELIGWSPISNCRMVKSDFDAESDIGFFKDHPINWLRVSAESFAIFYPEDAHAPLAGNGPVHKVVIKVAL